MDLDTQLRNSALALELLNASGLTGAQRQRAEQTLLRPEISSLITSEKTVRPVVAKLTGKRGINLTPQQYQLLVATKYLPQFDYIVGDWLANRTDQDAAYALEFVIASYDVGKKGMSIKGNGADLADGLTFKDYQTLRDLSGHSDGIRQVYGRAPQSQDFTRHADDVARSLVGRTLALPAGNAVIIEAEGYETNESITTSRRCMLAAPGQIDVMPNRGHTLLNIGTLKVGKPSCVMIRAIDLGGEIIEGSGRVGQATDAQNLVGLVVGAHIDFKGNSAPSGYIPAGAQYSTGRHRQQ